VRVTPRSVYNTNPNSRERGRRFARRTRNPDGGLALQNEPEAGITARVILIKRTGVPMAAWLYKTNCGARDASLGLQYEPKFP